MEITARQSFLLFGAWTARKMASWDDIKSLNKSWKQLRNELMFTAKQLHKLQPDKQEWVSRGSLTLHDLPDMVLFPMNPFTDLHADLAEVWSMRWNAEMLHAMGVRYDHMFVRGLTPLFMYHLGYSLGQWHLLGLKAKHLQATWTESDCEMVFRIDKREMLSILRNFDIDRTDHVDDTPDTQHKQK